MADVHEEPFHVAASHPALPGHFPGKPVVPGVVVLERVAAAIRGAWALRVTGLPQVKFLRPLQPDRSARLQIARADGTVCFRVIQDAELIASGVCEVAA